MNLLEGMIDEREVIDLGGLERILGPTPAQRKKLQIAYCTSSIIHEGIYRMERDGEGFLPFVSHPRAVAVILANLGYDSDTVCAALCHDGLEKGKVTDGIYEIYFEENRNFIDIRARLDMIKVQEFDTLVHESRFSELSGVISGAMDSDDFFRLYLIGTLGEDIYRMVSGCTNDYQNPDLDKQTNKDMFLNHILEHYFIDPLIIVIKAADRYHNLLTFDLYDDEQQSRILKETVNSYLPVIKHLDTKLHRALSEKCEELVKRYDIDVGNGYEKVNFFFDVIELYAKLRDDNGLMGFIDKGLERIGRKQVDIMDNLKGYVLRRFSDIDLVTVNSIKDVIDVSTFTLPNHLLPNSNRSNKAAEETLNVLLERSKIFDTIKLIREYFEFESEADISEIQREGIISLGYSTVDRCIMPGNISVYRTKSGEMISHLNTGKIDNAVGYLSIALGTCEPVMSVERNGEVDYYFDMVQGPLIHARKIFPGFKRNYDYGQNPLVSDFFFRNEDHIIKMLGPDFMGRHMDMMMSDLAGPLPENPYMVVTVKR